MGLDFLFNNVNAINIYAERNGYDAGQSVVFGMFKIVEKALYYARKYTVNLMTTTAPLA